jgi:hypothetical protein
MNKRMPLAAQAPLDGFPSCHDTDTVQKAPSPCSGGCYSSTTHQEHGITICETSSLAVAVSAMLGRRADIVHFRAGTTERRALEQLVNLLGGERDSGPFERYRRIAYDPRKTSSIAESCDAHALHTDGSFEQETPAIFALHCESADPNGGGTNTFVSVRRMREEMPCRLFEAMTVAFVRFSRKDDSGREDCYTGPMFFRRSRCGSWGLRWRDDAQVRPVVVNDHGTPIREAIDWVRAFLIKATPVSMFNNPGDIVLVNNDTVWHGRTALSPNSARSIIRAWIQV